MKEKRPRLLFIVQLPPPVHGASLMNSYLVKSDYLALRYAIRTLPLRFAKKASDIGKMRLGKILEFARTLIRLIYELTWCRPELVYITPATRGFALIRDYILIFLSRLTGIPVLAHLHGRYIPSKESAAAWFLQKQIQKIAKAICLSESLASEYETQFGIQPYIVTNGIPDIVYNASNPSEARVVSDALRVLWLSNLKREKGLHDLLEALMIVREEGGDLITRIAGSPASVSTESLCELIQEKGLSQHVEYVGSVDEAKKVKLLSDSQVLVLPSWNEACPVVIIEAMRQSIAVVSTTVGGIPDIVKTGKTGILVPPRNPRKLAEVLLQLSNAPKVVARMGKAGRKRYEEYYQYRNVENDLGKILDDILKPTPSKTQ